MREIDDAFMFGPAILAAPFLLEQKDGRDVYLPAGCDWYDFTTGQRHKGGETVTVKAVNNAQNIENIPLFVRANSLVPLAEPVPFVAGDTVFKINVRAFGENPGPFCLFEDDGVTYDFERGVQNRIVLSIKNGKLSVMRDGKFNGKRYEVDPVVEILK